MPPLGISTFRKLRRFERAYNNFDASLKDAVDDCIKDLFLETIPRGRQVKPMQGYKNPKIWEARVNRNFRLTFEMNGTIAILRNVGPHEILDNP